MTIGTEGKVRRIVKSNVKVRSFAVGMLLLLSQLAISCSSSLIGFRSTSDLRQKLLIQTPKGTSSVKVLAFVLTTLKPDEVLADGRYIDQFQASWGIRPPKVYPWASRIISVEIGEGKGGLFVDEVITAVWGFDNNDRLSDIRIDGNKIGM